LKEKREFDKRGGTQQANPPRYEQKNRGVRQISRYQYQYEEPLNTQFMPLGQNYPVVQIPEYYVPHQRGRGRGSQRGRGRGRGRGSHNPNLNPAFGNRRGQFYTDISK